MSVLQKIAYYQNRQDEVPNQELARELAQGQDRMGIQEIATGLYDHNPNIQRDCIKVLYEIGYQNPELIVDYVDDFLNLLKSSNNRLVWGSMIALATIAGIKAEVIFEHLDEIETAMDKGSVITRDNGVKVLAIVAAGDNHRRKEIFPHLINHLQRCRPKDVAQYAEKILLAVLSNSGASCVRNVIKEAQKC